MKKLKLLYITKDFSNFVEQNQVYFVQELARQTNLEVWEMDGHIQEILKKIKFQPDFILLNDYKSVYSPTITGLSSLTIPFGIIMQDLQWDIQGRKTFIKTNHVPHIFSICRDKFHEWYPEFSNRMIWLPHFVNTEIFKDYSIEKDIDWLFMGCYSWGIYPLREKVVQIMKDKPGFIMHDHPGYWKVHKDSSSVFIGEKYAKEINRAKIFFTCDSIYKYPVMKYYEVLACNTLLLASASKELRDLGFVPGENFVEINENNILEKAKYYLANEEERKRIAYNGYKMVHKNHSLKKRCADLVTSINRIINSS